MAEKDGLEASMAMDREVIRCQVCGLVQYRTRTGNCRRCLRLLPPKVTFVIPTPSPQDLPGDDRQLFENWPNRETVENIGQRIRQLRESRGMTQSQLQARSRVSRSYLSRIESGQMTPSLGTLEKIAEALRRRSEPLLRPGDEWRDGSRGSVHSGSSAVPAAAGLDAVAGHSQEAAGDQRPRQLESSAASAAASADRAHAATAAASAVWRKSVSRVSPLKLRVPQAGEFQAVRRARYVVAPGDPCRPSPHGRKRRIPVRGIRAGSPRPYSLTLFLIQQIEVCMAARPRVHNHG